MSWTRRSAMSIPAETPAAVTILPCSTMRSGTGSAPSEASRSRASQWVVAGDAVEEPGGGEEQRRRCRPRWSRSWSRGRSRIQSCSGSCSSSDPVAEAAGDDDDVRAPDLVERGVRDQGEGVGLVADRPCVLGDEDRLVARHGVEDVVRPGDVEGGEAVVEQVGDLHCLLQPGSDLGCHAGRCTKLSSRERIPTSAARTKTWSASATPPGIEGRVYAARSDSRARRRSRGGIARP